MDLSQYKTGRFGMRWRTEAEVFQGKGTNYQFKHTTATECMQGAHHAALVNVLKPEHPTCCHCRRCPQVSLSAAVSSVTDVRSCRHGRFSSNTKSMAGTAKTLSRSASVHAAPKSMHQAIARVCARVCVHVSLFVCACVRVCSLFTTLCQ